VATSGFHRNFASCTILAELVVEQITILDQPGRAGGFFFFFFFFRRPQSAGPAGGTGIHRLRRGENSPFYPRRARKLGPPSSSKEYPTLSRFRHLRCSPRIILEAEASVKSVRPRGKTVFDVDDPSDQPAFTPIDMEARSLKPNLNSNPPSNPTQQSEPDQTGKELPQTIASNKKG